jgi:hypothetical protein
LVSIDEYMPNCETNTSVGLHCETQADFMFVAGTGL